MIAARIEQLRERWAALQPRERTALAIGAAVVLLTVLWVGIVQPLRAAHAEAAAELARQRAIALDLERLAARLPATPAARAPASTQSLLTLVDQSIRSGPIGKPAARLQPDGESRVRVWMEDVRFDAVVQWLDGLRTRYGVRVESADIDRAAGAGLVDLRLSLSRE